MNAFFIVATPIGNLADLTYRAVEVLRSADTILAEDTRRTGVLLRHYEIEGRLISANEHNEKARAELLVELLREGQNVALVSDAGTPLLSDPGARLVRAALDAGYDVVPVPGPSALLAALAASGVSADRFTFYGFIPRKGGDRKRLLDEIAASPYTSVLYESPHRTAALIADLSAAAGPDRRVAVARELTKVHEEFFRGSLGEALQRFEGVEIRGEIVVVVEGRSGEAEPAVEEGAATAMAEALLARGVPPKTVARELRDRLGMPRNEAYELVLSLGS